jgi:hypothetical protein
MKWINMQNICTYTHTQKKNAHEVHLHYCVSLPNGKIIFLFANIMYAYDLVLVSYLLMEKFYKAFFLHNLVGVQSLFLFWSFLGIPRNRWTRLEGRKPFKPNIPWREWGKPDLLHSLHSLIVYIHTYTSFHLNISISAFYFPFLILLVICLSFLIPNFRYSAC